MNQANDITKGLVVLLNDQGIVEAVYTGKFPNNLVSDLSQVEDEYGEINLVSVLSVMRETDNIEDDHVDAGVFMVHLGVLQDAQVARSDTGFWIVIDGPDSLVIEYPGELEWQEEMEMFSSHKGPYNLNAMYSRLQSEEWAVQPTHPSGVEYYNSFANDDYHFLLQCLACEVQDQSRVTNEAGELEPFNEGEAKWQKLCQIARHAVDRAKAAEEGGAA